MQFKNVWTSVVVGLALLSSTVWLEDDSKLRQDKRDELVLKAAWIPFGDSKYKFAEQWDTLKQLTPNEPSKAYSQDELSIFQPPADAKLGDVWDFDVTKLMPILRQFHKGATHQLHHGGPQGAYGCISAENEMHVRIRTRAHAEFTLKDGVYLPSQFAGDIILERASKKFVALKLFVPPRRNNVDLNWDREPPKDEKWMDAEGNIIPAKKVGIADIGYCEKMELAGGDWDVVSNTKWDEELSYREVDKKFQKEFYPAAAIDWLPWEEAVAASQETAKPLHAVALFGVLDDESC